MNTDSRKRQFQGVVASDKMDKTIVVVVESTKVYQKYHKQYVVRKKYKVHDPKNEYHTGDKVIFEETRPMSRAKRWQVVSKIQVTNVQNDIKPTL